MREREAGNAWCPMGRISIQRGDVGAARIEAVQTGAFNRALIHAPNADGAWAYPSRCLGEGCAWWRWGTLSRLGVVPARHRCGRCAAASPGRISVFLPAVLAAAAFLAARLLS